MAFRFANNTLSHKHIRKWFADELNGTGPLPSDDHLFDLAEQLKRLLHRADNAEYERSGQLDKLKDVSPGEILLEKTQSLIKAAKEYQEFLGDNFRADNDNVDLVELQDLLLRMTSVNPPGRKKGDKGRRPQPWKSVAREFAVRVRNLLKQIGVRGPLSLTDPSSHTIAIVRKAINWAYGIDLSEEGVVSAIRDRDRRNPKLPRSPPADLLARTSDKLSKFGNG